jgi:predicted TIM-barrel fold metal-dependent hydrolase
MSVRLLGSSLLLVATACAHAPSRPAGDFHQHLFGRGTLELSPALERVTARELIAKLDSAGIRRAALLSIAYQFANPNRPPIADEYARVKAENDWTADQAALYPDRLRALCAVNPLRDWALQEIERCSADPRLRRGLKLHFGNSDVDLEKPEHVERLRGIFAAANARRMAVVVHMHPSVTMKRAYGARFAHTFLDRVVAASPDVPVQVAHLGGAGRFDEPALAEVLDVFAKAVADHDPHMRNLYFDMSGMGDLTETPQKAALAARRIRQLGVQRVLFGSDGAVQGNSPLVTWKAFRKIPLSEDEIRTIQRNVPPYMR